MKTSAACPQFFPPEFEPAPPDNGHESALFREPTKKGGKKIPFPKQHAAAHTRPDPTCPVRIIPEEIILVIEQLRSSTRVIAEMLLNGLSDIEAISICGAQKYAHTTLRQHARTGTYLRHIRSAAGMLSLRLPILRNMPFRKISVDRFRIYHRPVVNQLAAMYLYGASATRLQAIAYFLWGPRPMPRALYDYGAELAWDIETLRNAPIASPPRNRVKFAALEIPFALEGGARTTRVLAAIEEQAPATKKIMAMLALDAPADDGWITFRRWLAARGMKNLPFAPP